jgi:transposase
MEPYYIGMDIHKKTISFCVKQKDGEVITQGIIPATRAGLTQWVSELPGPWIGAMEATIFTGWVYDFLKPHAMELKIAHPQMLKAIVASKKKNDKIDAFKIADLLRCNLLPECYMAAEDIRELRRILRFRNLMVHQAIRMQNKMSGLLMEYGVEYNKKKLRGKKYFDKLLMNLEVVPESVISLLGLSRSGYEMFRNAEKKLIKGLRHHLLIKERVRRLMTIPGIGEITALTWALEVGDPMRFSSVRKAISYCGLCSAQKESAGKNYRGPISKQRNKHLQTALVEAAKLAPYWNERVVEIHIREFEKGNRNRATLAVARKLVAFMLAVDKAQKEFQPLSKGVKAAA